MSSELDRSFADGAGIAALAVLRAVLPLLVQNNVVQDQELHDALDAALLHLEEAQAAFDKSGTHNPSALKSARFLVQTLIVPQRFRSAGDPPS
ncbi:hypothetical protein [Xanthobacter sp. ZOL 2024]